MLFDSKVPILCVTDRTLCENFLDQIKKIAKAKPSGIILREKDLLEDDYEILARKVLTICKENQVPLILHKFVNVAKRENFKNLHLPAICLREESRDSLKNFSILGASCHNLEEARLAEEKGCAYIVFGHVFETSCKENLPPRGLKLLEEIVKSVSVPVYAIGGIRPRNVRDVLNAGAYGICLRSAFMRSENPEKLKEEFTF